MDVSLRPEITEYDGYMLMKFTSKEQYRQDFLDGKLFFNTSDFFARCDDAGRGDGDEGKTFIIDPEKPAYMSANLEKVGDTFAIVVRAYSGNPEEYKRGTIWDYSSAINRDRKVLSLYTAYVDLAGKKVAPFSENMKAEFGEFGILILNRQVFFQRVHKALVENNFLKESYMGFVEYLPEVEQNGLIDWHPFVKKDRFKYQNEFRITFVSDNADPVMLDLGCSLRDIAVAINADDLKDIHFDDENLLYPVYEHQAESCT